MEELTPLLEKLAEKLGTTTDYLWGVLIKQAPITATVKLVYLALVIIGGIALYKIHKRLCREVDGCNGYFEFGELAMAPMVVATIIWAVLFIICFFQIGTIVTGFFNPEYWALDEVMSLIK
jgi:hypothetical protein